LGVAGGSSSVEQVQDPTCGHEISPIELHASLPGLDDQADLGPIPVPVEHLVGGPEQLAPLAEVVQRPLRLGPRPHRRGDQPAPLREFDRLGVDREPRCRSIRGPDHVSEVDERRRGEGAEAELAEAAERRGV
jgi:hypothetical protein